MIDEGYVKVNGKTEKNKYLLKENDELEIQKREAKDLNLEALNLNIEIVYEDDYVAVVYKPEGMVVHPANGNDSNTLVNGLLYHSKLSNLETILDNLENKPLLPRMQKLLNLIYKNLDSIKSDFNISKTEKIDNLINLAIEECLN